LGLTRSSVSQRVAIMRQIYHRVGNREVKQRIDKIVLVSAFLNLEEFSF
jgi:hypothetical protein